MRKKTALSKKLTREALVHGEVQVKKMLRDRPAMKEQMTNEDGIWKWAVKKFAGEDLSETIDWNEDAPYQEGLASHAYPCRSERGYIRVKEGLSFEQSWAGAVFELINIAYHDEFKRTIHAAYIGELARENFPVEMARIEFKAVKEAEKFYNATWKPWADNKGISSDPEKWSVGAPDCFEEWLDYFDKDGEYPWKIYYDFYDHHLEEWELA
ncbi:MAG TPA: hypothetical protein VLJ10_02715 [Candidatus Bathyarchaeia archaeon]|nr:hypothetical protein [Candidatus Bathyarchaeia archaeon]